MSIAENVARIKAEMAQAAIAAGRDPKDILLCAATKMNDAENVRQAIAAGVDCCGENRVQELTQKLSENAYEGAPVHFIGHLQTNKVNKVVGQVELIHSVDSERLLRAIDTQAAKLGICQDILLEVNIAEEESKGGIPPCQVREMAVLAGTMEHVRLRGLMAIPPVSTVPGGNRRFFAEMNQLFVDIKGEIAHNQNEFNCLSMGMSGDFEEAIAQGSTLVRVGTALFGPRPPMASAQK
jgi:pyridoxal phosphate enzyme (YggS family)